MGSKLVDEFMVELTKCRVGTIFIAVARTLGVELRTTEKDEEGHFIPKPFEDMVCDVVEAFSKAGRREKKDTLKMFKEWNREAEVKMNAARAENSEKAIQD